VPVERISREELKANLDRGEDVVLVEALGEAGYDEAHLLGAINIPYDRVDELAPSMLPDKGAQIVVYCYNGPCRNSGIASNRLSQLGYEDVRDYHEGKQDWIEARLPTENGGARVAG
jgi:rhodanese-related sulfurtransferase